MNNPIDGGKLKNGCGQENGEPEEVKNVFRMVRGKREVAGGPR